MLLLLRFDWLIKLFYVFVWQKISEFLSNVKKIVKAFLKVISKISFYRLVSVNNTYESKSWIVMSYPH